MLVAALPRESLITIHASCMPAFNTSSAMSYRCHSCPKQHSNDNPTFTHFQNFQTICVVTPLRETPLCLRTCISKCRVFRKGGVITSLDGYTAVPSSTSTAAQTASHPPSAPPTRLGPQIGSSNVGYRLLKQAGWQEGQGLGSSQQGRSIPLAAYHQQVSHLQWSFCPCSSPSAVHW